MSLEDAINRHAAALDRLAAAMEGRKISPPEAQPDAAPVKPVKAAKTPKPEPAPTTEAAAPPAPAVPAAPAATTPAADAPVDPRALLAGQVLVSIKAHGRDKVIAALGTVVEGAQKQSAIPDAKVAEAIAALKAIKAAA